MQKEGAILHGIAPTASGGSERRHRGHVAAFGIRGAVSYFAQRGSSGVFLQSGLLSLCCAVSPGAAIELVYAVLRQSAANNGTNHLDADFI